MNGSTETFYSEPTPNGPGAYQRKPRLFKQDTDGARDNESANDDQEIASDKSSAADEKTSENGQTKPQVERKAVGFYETPYYIYELGFNGTETYFIRYNFATGQWDNYIKEIPVRKDLLLVPLNDDLITSKNAVRLPMVPLQYGSEKALYMTIKHFIHRYLGVSYFYEQLASYYVMFTWVYDKFKTVPYLRALGDYGTGKTRFLLTIGSLCYRPILASGATTVSPIFRMIDKYRGTLIVDEADFKNSEAHAEIVKIFNVGYQNDFPVIRSELINNRYEPVGYQVYGPKLAATRKRFGDTALESRCITEDMEFKGRPDIPTDLPSTFWDEAQIIRNMLLQWRFDKYRNIQLRPERINESIEPRLNQVMMPLASIIEDQKMLSELRMFAEQYNKNIIVERNSLLEAEVLQVIMDLAVGGNITPQMKEIADRYNSERDEEEHIKPRRVGSIIREKLKLRTERDQRNTIRLKWDGEKIAKLCEKYGIVGTSAGRSDVADIL